MHELPVMNSILAIVEKHAKANNVTKVMKIYLRVGELADLEDKWMQHYFDYLTKDGIADGAKLVIKRVPAVMKCSSCGHEFEMAVKEDEKIICTECREEKCSIISGREYYIENMEVI